MAAADGFVETGLLRLETENFKSYKGAHTIGPFKSFTSVIGIDNNTTHLHQRNREKTNTCIHK